MPKSSLRDKAEGEATKMAGRLREAAGALRGRRRTKAHGQAEQVAGTMKEKKGQAKDIVD